MFGGCPRSPSRVDSLLKDCQLGCRLPLRRVEKTKYCGWLECMKVPQLVVTAYKTKPCHSESDLAVKNLLLLLSRRRKNRFLIPGGIRNDIGLDDPGNRPAQSTECTSSGSIITNSHSLGSSLTKE